MPEAVDLVPPVPKGEIVELARAANPEEANADEDVWIGWVVVASIVGVFVVESDLLEARVPNGEIVELLAKPLVGEICVVVSPPSLHLVEELQSYFGR